MKVGRTRLKKRSEAYSTRRKKFLKEGLGAAKRTLPHENERGNLKGLVKKGLGTELCEKKSQIISGESFPVPVGRGEGPLEKGERGVTFFRGGRVAGLRGFYSRGSKGGELRVKRRLTLKIGSSARGNLQGRRTRYILPGRKGAM